MKATIVIPCYNHARFLGQAIRSVLDQTHQDLEVIVVDDGSQDDTAGVGQSFGEPVRYIWQENQGLSAARNTGLRLARGDVIGVLDADDMYESGFLKTLLTILGDQPGAAAAYCGYRFVDARNRPLPEFHARTVLPEAFHNTLMLGNFLVPESLLVRRDCYDQVGYFDESLRACEDWDMWLRISSQYRVVGTERILTRHRILSGSMSSDPDRMLNNRLAVLAKHLGSQPRSVTDSAAVGRCAYGRAYLVTAIEYLQDKDVRRAYDCLISMAQHSPELFLELDTYYELGCGDQPKGYRGHFASLDIHSNAEILLRLVTCVLETSKDRPGIQAERRKVLSLAYCALGLLAYGANDFAASRHFLIQSAWAHPNVILRHKFLLTLIKTFLGQRMIRLFRSHHGSKALCKDVSKS